MIAIRELQMEFTVDVFNLGLSFVESCLGLRPSFGLGYFELRPFPTFVLPSGLGISSFVLSPPPSSFLRPWVFRASSFPPHLRSFGLGYFGLCLSPRLRPSFGLGYFGLRPFPPTFVLPSGSGISGFVLSPPPSSFLRAWVFRASSFPPPSSFLRAWVFRASSFPPHLRPSFGLGYFGLRPSPPASSFLRAWVFRASSFSPPGFRGIAHGYSVFGSSGGTPYFFWRARPQLQPPRVTSSSTFCINRARRFPRRAARQIGQPYSQ